MKFNPICHGAVVSNYREAFFRKHNYGCCLPDVRIWDIQDSIVLPTSEEQDEFTLEEMEKEHTAAFTNNGRLRNTICSFTVRIAKAGLTDVQAERAVAGLQREIERAICKVASEFHAMFTVDI